MTFDARAWLWFFSSYGPLWLMLGLRFDGVALRVMFFVIGAASILLVARLLSRRAKERPTSTSVTITGDGGGEVGGYLATYLLPFRTVADPAWTDLFAYGIFIVVAGLIYTSSDLMQINPTV